MTTEALLKPRYKVIADYPGNSNIVGDMINIQNAGTPEAAKLVCWWYDKFPHLFQKLEWWEDRKPEEMPEYVKYWDISLYFPQDVVCKGVEAPFNTNNFTAQNFQPASKEEYETYLKTTK